MDSKLFRLPTTPNFYEPIQSARPVNVTEISRGQVKPAPDSRFPGFPGQMEDGRLVTDYDSHCSHNIPAGKQFPTKAFMQKKADEIIGISRRLSAKRMGADFMFDTSVVPPLAEVVSCTRSACSREVNSRTGIGSGRHEPVPELFGTYTIPYTVAPTPKVGFTHRYEGGRNSLRGSDPYGVFPAPLIQDGRTYENNMI